MTSIVMCKKTRNWQHFIPLCMCLQRLPLKRINSFFLFSSTSALPPPSSLKLDPCNPSHLPDNLVVDPRDPLLPGPVRLLLRPGPLRRHAPVKLWAVVGITATPIRLFSSKIRGVFRERGMGQKGASNFSLTRETFGG